MLEQPAREVIREAEQVLAYPGHSEDERAAARAILATARDLAHQYEVVLKIDHDAILTARFAARDKMKAAMDELQAAVKAAITYEAREGKADA